MKQTLIFLCVFVFLITLSNTHFTCECGLSNNEIHILENVKRNTCVERCNELVSNPCNTRNSVSCSCTCDNKLVQCTSKTTNSISGSSISSTTSKTTDSSGSGSSSSSSSTSETSGTTETTGNTTSSVSTGSSGPSGTGSGSNPYTASSGSGSGSGTGSGTANSATTLIDTGSQPPVSGNGCDDSGTGNPYISITDKLGEKIALLQNECQTSLCPCSTTVLNVTAIQVIFD